jgi:hypothetical protein
MTWLDRLIDEGGLRSSLSGRLEGWHLKRDPWDPTLEALCAALPVEDAQALRAERAGILEHEAGLSRMEAEARAGMTRAHWLA